MRNHKRNYHSSRSFFGEASTTENHFFLVNKNMKIQVLLFASARQAAGGQGHVEVTLNDESDNNNDDNNNNDDATPAAAATAPPTTDQLRRVLAERYPGLAKLVLDQNESITLALNEEYVPAGQNLPLHEGDTVAVIPPISGG